jgi:ABC-type branched-subunit amino acid transport system permease subunit
MKEVRNNVLLSLGALAVMSVFLYLGFSGGWNFKLGLWGVISFGAAAFFAWEAYDKATVILRSKKGPADHPQALWLTLL